MFPASLRSAAKVSAAKLYGFDGKLGQSDPSGVSQRSKPSPRQAACCSRSNRAVHASAPRHHFARVPAGTRGKTSMEIVGSMRNCVRLSSQPLTVRRPKHLGDAGKCRYSANSLSAFTPFFRCSTHSFSFDFNFFSDFFDFADFRSFLICRSFFSNLAISFSSAFIFFLLSDFSESNTSQSRSTIFFTRILLCLFRGIIRIEEY